MGGIAELQAALRDVFLLSKCRILVPDEPPHRGTFLMLAMLIGGLRPCPTVAAFLNATSAWQVLCADEVGIIREIGKQGSGFATARWNDRIARLDHEAGNACEGS